jgi:hypothetical protein
MGLTGDQVQEIAQRAANGWLSRQALDPAGDLPVERMAKGRAARMIQERSMREASTSRP